MSHEHGERIRVGVVIPSRPIHRVPLRLAAEGCHHDTVPARHIGESSVTGRAGRVRYALLALTIAAAMVSGPMVQQPSTAATSASTTAISRPLVTLIKRLPVAAPSHVGSYDRSKYGDDWASRSTKWGYCNTRALVLIAESAVATTRNSNCTVLTGKWFSWYNDKTYTNAYGGTYVQIDHMVPVENSWQSGAWSWTKATRVRFYNDLGDARSLNAVDSYDNEAKGASAPDEWLPRYHRCKYIRYWAAVKTRWSLTVTKSEKAALLRIASGCPNTTVNVTKASIAYR
jgi:hypothetical protein